MLFILIGFIDININIFVVFSACYNVKGSMVICFINVDLIMFPCLGIGTKYLLQYFGLMPSQFI